MNGVIGTSTLFLLFLILLGTILPSTNSKTASTKKKRKLAQYDTSLYLNICVSSHPHTSTTLDKTRIKNKNHHRALQWLLQTAGERGIVGDSSHQHKAACWMLYGKPTATRVTAKTKSTTASSTTAVSKEKHTLVNAPSQQFAQRFALAVLYYATQGDDKWEIRTNWMSNKHECTWYGVICGDTPFIDQHVVVGLDLGFNQLNGLLPRELALLSNIQEVDFHGNDLQGIIPHGIMYAWTKCKILRLHMNGFFGNLHSEIGHMVALEELHLFGNYLGGTLPRELANLKKLQVLDVYANAFEGTIPSHLGNLKQLKELDVHDNFFVGSMPQEVCERKLKFLVADCLEGAYKEIGCKCCTICCEGLPNMKCVDQATGKEVIVGMQ